MLKSIFRRNIFKGAATDSVLLTFVKVITSVFGLLVTKLLSTQFSLAEYGTYSQAMLIATTATSLSILGLTNAVNYFYNSTSDETRKEENISTIFSLQFFVGTLCAVLIMLFHVPIINYFNNDELEKVIYIAAWMPLFSNLLAMIQVLFVSIGKAKLMAIRNFFVSAVQLSVVAIACFVTKNIRTIFAVILLVAIAQVIYFIAYFTKAKFAISLKRIRIDYIPEILRFSIPMAVYVLTNELTRDIDKYVISFFGGTETLAIYTNAARVLPFDLITASFITVLIPIVTRQIGQSRYIEAQGTFKAYLRLGYVATWIIAGGAVVVSKELMLFLYSAEYLPGLAVFIIYLFVDMIKFANTSLILTAKGKTNVLMYCSIGSLAVNFVMNIIAYKIFGMIGPAITTLIITLALTVLLLSIGAKEIETSIIALFDWKEMATIVAELLIIGAIASILRLVLIKFSVPYILILVLVYCFYLGCMAILSKKRLLDCLRAINRLK